MPTHQNDGRLVVFDMSNKISGSYQLADVVILTGM